MLNGLGGKFARGLKMGGGGGGGGGEEEREREVCGLV